MRWRLFCCGLGEDFHQRIKIAWLEEIVVKLRLGRSIERGLVGVTG